MAETNKEAVKLRKKKLSDGKESLYLDIYVDGKRKYEYLKLYLNPGRENKLRNKETLALANAVKAQRTVEIQNGRFGFENKNRTKRLLGDFLDEYVSDKRDRRTEGYANDIETVVKHVRKYMGARDIFLTDIDKAWCRGFVNYLGKVRSVRGGRLSKITINNYFTVMLVALNRAVKLELIDRNPFDSLPDDDRPKKGSTKREYLTLDEVRELVNTGIKDERVKNAFLFSCFTGLRFSDIINLKWENYKELEDGVAQLEFVQQKTKQQVVVPLPGNALQWLPNRGWDYEPIFDLPHHSVVGKKLRKWVANAGISKNVTFHVARHTYATLLLYYGADLYTVSKLLGHTNIQTTQIYAKVMDESKRKAVNLIPEI